MTLTVLPGRLAICRLPAGEELPSWALSHPFLSITRTPEELSVVCADDSVPQEVSSQPGWRCLKVEGPLDFALTGILLSPSPWRKPA